jgi:predicted MFS family arabinose efflux permease
MVFFSLGCAIVVIWPDLWAFGLSLAVIALAKVVYDPAMQAYLGDTVPYERRGRAVSITELSWAGAFFLGMPLVGLAIQRQGWQVPFAWLGLLGIGSAVLLWRALPVADGRSGQITSLKSTWRVLRQQPVIWVAALYIMLMMGANELLLIVYGAWMEGTFDLALTALGLATAVIGIAEVTGEISVGLAVDRLGKRPVIITTGLLAAFMYIVIPFTSISLVAALVGLFLLFLFFEMTVVGGIPLMTELVPAARGVVMSVILAAAGLGRAMGALLGPALWTGGDLRRLGLVAGGLMIVAVAILTLWIREGEAEKQNLGI